MSCKLHEMPVRCSSQQVSFILLSHSFFSQLENIGNFVRAITEYGLRPHDIFEANDLFENVNHTQVQCTLIALAGMVRIDTHTTHVHTRAHVLDDALQKHP